MDKKRLVVIGGGAAGFFCAINAAAMNPAMEVVIVEKSGKFLSKVLVSGGGRCNVTHSCFSIDEMIRKYPRGSRFLKKAFHNFFTTDTVKWFEKRGVELKTESDGRMFPKTNTSRTIIDCLMMELNKNRVELLLNKEVKKLKRVADKWELTFAEDVQHADYICIACGGYPKPASFQWIEELGHTIEEPVPSLFTFNLPGHPITELMGVSVDHARVKIVGTNIQQEGPVLITHWGLSGPAVLKTSAWGARELHALGYKFKVIINWLPQFNDATIRDEFSSLRTNNASQKVMTKNPFALPNRLWEFLNVHSNVKPDMRWADLSSAVQNKLIKNLITYEIDANGKTTFKEEFVTAGGVVLNEIDHTTMESKIVPAIFFAGEIMDVDGVTGGFNFQHAWTSGWIAAHAIASRAIDIQGS